MLTIQIDNSESRVVEPLDKALFDKISKAMSYRVEGAEFSELCKSGKWDGYRHLFRKRAQTFSSGLLYVLRGVLEENSIPFTLQDMRQCPNSRPPLTLHNISLYPFQQKAVEEAIQKQRGVIRMPTGSGKTLVIAGILATLGLPAVVYIHRKDIFYQLHRRFEEWLHRKIGLIGDGHEDIREINIAMVQTVTRVFGHPPDKNKYSSRDNTRIAKPERLRSLVRSSPVYILDESQHQTAATILRISNHSTNAYYRLLFSATPFRETNDDLVIEAASARKIVDISASQLIQEGYLAKPTIWFVKIPHQTYPSFLTYSGLYREAIARNLKRNLEIVKASLKFIEQGKTVLVAVTYVEHGKTLEKLLKKYALPEYCEKIRFVYGDSETELRRRSLQELNQRKISALTATTIFGEGVDVPNLDVLINAKAMKSRVDSLQVLGRALRKTPTKDKATIVDFWDDSPYFKNHAQAREATYKTEPEFGIHHVSDVSEIE